jgi:hypothetical protein
MKSAFLVLLLILWTFSAQNALARTTPQDILNAQMDSFNQATKNYSPQSKQKLQKIMADVTEINKKRTAELEAITEMQGEILDEHQRRLGKDYLNDAFHSPNDGRDSSDPIEKARYWITFAHEAVAYQAAKTYLPNPTGEQNLKRDSLNLVSAMQSDLETTKAKVLNSQKMLEAAVR